MTPVDSQVGYKNLLLNEPFFFQVKSDFLEHSLKPHFKDQHTGSSDWRGLCTGH